jgi:peroxiredoxin
MGLAYQFKQKLVLLAVPLLVATMAWAATDIAPDFSLPDEKGAVVSLQDFDGQVVLINFWASWCGPCREEMPLLDELHKRYEPLGFTMLGVNVEEDSAAADHFLSTTSVSFPILYDRKNEVSKLYDVIAMPSTVILDREGNLRHVHHGYEPGYENDYQDQIRALLKE